MNPELGVPVLDALWVHFGDFYEEDEEVLPPLSFSNIYAIRDPDVILKVKRVLLLCISVQKNSAGTSREFDLCGRTDRGKSGQARRY